MNNGIFDMIALEEKRYSDNVDAAVERICASRSKLVLVAGASCSGKTTTTGKLSHQLRKRGIETSVVSIDDFYRTFDLNAYHETELPDVEAPESLDLPYLRECFESLLGGKTTLIPHYDFKSKKRSDEYIELKIDDGEICLIEGLHALNPVIYGDHVDRDSIFKLYLYCSDAKISDPRFFRRLVRDYYHRSASACLTFSMWESVRNGEKKYIEPFMNDADFSINTHYDYEIHVLKDDAQRILSEVPHESRWYERSKELYRFLMNFQSVSSMNVPPYSLMREFIK